ncbi:hypothetical protein K458DRAFT_413344 [Lentithecium fluviatile CBS 122367]|uniref:N-acetyltransferase domain-containing protein n=1 Tax=Lentithecium fluviatile CBS 122367 TaxID=1168545 RepID=A0A6G1JFR3_9PLEO|nr:hypothetical protein K458DRAFT_413344 [Lentithecium fluviatile CBS 122367]
MEDPKPQEESSTATSAPPNTAWRQLTAPDIPSLVRIANSIHPDLPESAEVFTERLALFPSGCFALVETAGIDVEGDNLCGYAISHPIRQRQPPALDILLKEIPDDADQYYIHDLAILERCQGRGFSHEGVRKMVDVGERMGFRTIGLVSVYGTSVFWGRFGFVRVEVVDVLAEKLKDYGEDAVFLERVGEGCREEERRGSART